jgi:hypothetical protein
MDDGEQVIQLTDNGSASPDKVAVAGDTMTGLLTAEAGITVDDSDLQLTGTALLKLLNAKAVQGRDALDANWRALIGVDSSDVCDVGDQNLDGGLRLNADADDSAVIAYGSGDKIIYHEGYLPPNTHEYESDEIEFVSGAGNTAGVDTHGIGSKPKAWMAVIRCKTAEHGYVADDEILVMGGTVGVSQFNFTIYLNGSTGFGWVAPTSQLRVLKVSTGDDEQIDDSKWRLVFYAWY